MIWTGSNQDLVGLEIVLTVRLELTDFLACMICKSDWSNWTWVRQNRIATPHALVFIEFPAIEHMERRLGPSPLHRVAKLQHGTPKLIDASTGKHCADSNSRGNNQRPCGELHHKLQLDTNVGMTLARQQEQDSLWWLWCFLHNYLHPSPPFKRIETWNNRLNRH